MTTLELPNLLLDKIYRDLLPHVKIDSPNPHNPVIVDFLPQPWQIIGKGNYAAVFGHPEYTSVVIKIYAPQRSGWAEEVEVYERLGSHPAFSQCLYAEPNWLILKRLYGTTLYDCLHLGIKINDRVIEDIDRALEYAISRGLYPHDVHGRNVMMSENRGLVVDISDFLTREPCNAWQDLKRAYYWLYRPFFAWHSLRVPYFILDLVRKSYRLIRNLRSFALKK